jgi:hypothetical protein
VDVRVALSAGVLGSPRTVWVVRDSADFCAGPSAPVLVRVLTYEHPPSTRRMGTSRHATPALEANETEVVLEPVGHLSVADHCQLGAAE